MSDAGSESEPSARTRIRRNSKRAAYGAEQVRAVLDANQVCHVAYVEDGEPRIIPTLYMRRGDFVYLHGNRQAALLRHMAAGGLVSVAVTCLDGVVVARSGFHCSMNYRSVVLFGHGQDVAEEEREALLDDFVEVLVPGHGAAVRRSTSQELAATAVVRLPIDEASAKIRQGPAIDDEADLDSDTWAGVIPLTTVAGEPVSNPDLKAGVPVPDYISGYRPPT